MFLPTFFLGRLLRLLSISLGGVRDRFFTGLRLLRFGGSKFKPWSAIQSEYSVLDSDVELSEHKSSSWAVESLLLLLAELPVVAALSGFYKDLQIIKYIRIINLN